jgi:hypothetical protein
LNFGHFKILTDVSRGVKAGTTAYKMIPKRWMAFAADHIERRQIDG